MVGAVAVLAPVFVQVALTFGLLFWSEWASVQAVRDGTVRTRDIALRERHNWPSRVIQLGNAAQNQLELPILYYLVSVLALFTGRATMTLVVLSWVFVGTRLFHALIHVTTNNVPRRFLVFMTGAVVLAVMWVLLAVELFLGP